MGFRCETGVSDVWRHVGSSRPRGISGIFQRMHALLPWRRHG
jgi:hypothetical protein